MPDSARCFSTAVGTVSFEQTNHLGDVVVTLSDKVLGADLDVDNTIDYYKSIVKSSSLTYPFGWDIPNRKFTAGENYRFGFNGTERSPEIGEGHNTTFFRENDTRIARWWSLDPITHEWQSPYAMMDNNPIALSDYFGADTGDDDIAFSVKGTTVEVVASRKNSEAHYDYGRERYDYGGDLKEWQKSYGCQGCSYEGTLHVWRLSGGAEKRKAYIQKSDKEERDRIVLEKLAFFLGAFDAITTVINPFPYSANTLAGLRKPFGLSKLQPEPPMAVKGVRRTSTTGSANSNTTLANSAPNSNTTIVNSAPSSNTTLANSLLSAPTSLHIFGKTVSPQKQASHGHLPPGKPAGGYMNSVADAQTVLDAFHSGNARVLGYDPKLARVVVHYPPVVGTFKAINGTIIGPSSVFTISGKSPHVFPSNPQSYGISP